jgi:ribosomal protein S18 acetylase RimI-like enzyme
MICWKWFKIIVSYYFVKEMKIRNANNKDIPSLLELLYELELPRPKTNAEKTQFRKLISKYIYDHDKQILVAESDSNILGMVSIVFMSRLNRIKLELVILDLVITNDYRRSGIGKSLIDSCILLAKKKKCFRIRLDSRNYRREAHEFYKSCGFEPSSLRFTKDTS